MWYESFLNELEKVSTAPMSSVPDLASVGPDLRIRNPHNSAVKRSASLPPKQSIRPIAKKLQKDMAISRPSNSARAGETPTMAVSPLNK
jgi:hypothetical protein